jgi:predicted RNA-binding protein with TRAM domain
MRKLMLILGCAAIVACGKQQPQVEQSANAATTPAGAKVALPAAIQEALPPSHPAVAPAQPAHAANPQLITGKIAQTMDAGGYTYLKLATAGGERWAAIRQTPVKKGSTVTVAVQMVAQDFESKTLNRKFDQIIFGAIAGDNAPSPMASAMANTGAAEHMKPTADTANVKVEKAKGGYAIAELWSEKATLQEKPVTVRGKVVKFLPEIMGKNWMHLRDGSGSREKGDDDITVTTTEAVKVGDVVTVTGTLRVDKDFGAGYRYPVIIEDAKLQKE